MKARTSLRSNARRGAKPWRAWAAVFVVALAGFAVEVGALHPGALAASHALAPIHK